MAPYDAPPRELAADLLVAYLATEVVGRDGTVLSGPGAAPDLGPTWVVTAENPFSELQDDHVNAAAMADLEAEIRQAGLDPVPLVGRAPDGSWSEDCFGVTGTTGDVVRRWGRDRGQHAVFLLTGTTHEVVSCWTGDVLAQRARDLSDAGGPTA